MTNCPTASSTQIGNLTRHRVGLSGVRGCSAFLLTALLRLARVPALQNFDLNPGFRFSSKCQWLWVAVVEDNELSRELLIRQIDRGLGLRCAGAYPTGEEALAEIPRSNAEVVLMDIRLPGMNGIECTRRLLRLLPALHIVVLTEYEEDALVFEALRAGAHGYLLREHTSPGELHKALTDVMTGGSPISSQIARKVIRHFQ